MTAAAGAGRPPGELGRPEETAADAEPPWTPGRSLAPAGGGSGR